MGWILPGACGSIAEIPVPSGDGAAVDIKIGGVKLHAEWRRSAGGTGGKGRHDGQLHCAEINQAVFRSWIAGLVGGEDVGGHAARANGGRARSEEHTSELQSLRHLVCRLL